MYFRLLKRFALIVCCAWMLVSLPCCGSEDANESATAQKAQQTEQAQPEPAAEPSLQNATAESTESSESGEPPTIYEMIGQEEGNVPDRALRLGVLAPLSGSFEAEGLEMVKAVKTAAVMFEREGGVAMYDAVWISPQDSACNEQLAARGANKHIAEGVAAVIGAFCSRATARASEALDQVSIPMFTPASTRADITARGLPYMFRVCRSDAGAAELAAGFAAKKLFADHVMIVHDSTEFGADLARYVVTQCGYFGITPPEPLLLDPESMQSLDSAVNRIIALEPEAVFLCFDNAEDASGLLTRIADTQTHALFVNPLPRYQAEHGPDFLRAERIHIGRIYFIVPKPVQDMAMLNQFQALYKELGFGKPTAVETFAAFDAAYAFLEAVDSAQSPAPDKIKAFLLSMDYHGASHRIRFRKNGDLVPDMQIKRAAAGTLVESGARPTLN